MNQALNALAIALVAFSFCGCAGSDAGTGAASTDTLTAQRSGAAATKDSLSTAAQLDERALAAPIRDDLVIYVDASTSEIDAARQAYSDEDFGVIADDLMFYRSSAIEYLEQHGQRFLRVTGRRPLRFQVQSATREYDFADVELLDFIIVYAADREPRVVAPNEVEMVAEHRKERSAY